MSRARLILLPAATVLTTALLAAPALYANHVESGMRWRGERLVPDVSGGATSIALAGVLVPFVLLVLLLTVGRKALAGRTRGFRLGYAFGAVFGQVILSLGLLGLVISSDPHLFGGKLLQRLPSPDGARTAYLYDGGFICGYDVYVAEGEAWTMKRVGALAMDCETTGGLHLEWTDAANVRVVH